MAYSGLGSGTVGDPYQVATADQLNEVRDYLSAYFIQTANIDLSGYSNWIPIGDNAFPFAGFYNGGNYNIENIAINIASYGGLFGKCFGDGCYLKNININNITITGTNNIHGGLCGSLQGVTNPIIIENVHIDGIIITGAIIGGLIGTIVSKVNITNSSVVNSNISISAVGSLDYAGGFVGSITSTDVTIERSFSKSNSIVSTQWGSASCGGFVGRVGSSTVLVCNNCYCFVTNLQATYKSTQFSDNTAGTTTNINCYAVVLSQSSSVKYGIDADTITNCYHNSETSGVGGGTGRTTAEMKYPTNLEYTGWDFTTIWRYDRSTYGDINGNYPLLRWQSYPIVEYLVDRQFKVIISCKGFKFEKSNYNDAMNIKCLVVEEESLTEID